MKKLRVLLLVAVFAFSLAVPCFAADDGTPIIVDGVSYPVMTPNYGNIIDWVDADPNRSAIIYGSGASVRLMLLDTHITTASSSYVPTTETFFEGAQYHRFTLVDGAWVYNTSAALISGGSIGTVNNIIVSSHDIKGNLYHEAVTQHVRFRGALPLMILEVAGERLKMTLPEMGGTMKTLVLCGVGLMASLVVLKLFGKRSLIFLRR